MAARTSRKIQTQALRSLAHTFYALKDVVRLEMLSVLAQRECTVNELAEALDKSQPLMSWHLRRLRAAGIVKIRRSGREANTPQAGRRRAGSLSRRSRLGSLAEPFDGTGRCRAAVRLEST